MTDLNSGKKRVVLFLQGPPSRFCRHIRDELVRRGHECRRINFCVADFLFWAGRPADNYLGRVRHFAGYLERYVKKHGVTDILYYADRLPYHRIAAAVARANGINAVTYEFGYLRPDWITLEKNGMSAQSHFPDDPEHIKRAAQGLPYPDLSPYHPFSFKREATYEVIFNLTNFFCPLPFIHYRKDKYYNSLREYLNYIPILMDQERRQKEAGTLINSLIASEKRLFVFPMQMQNDYQIRANSHYNLQETAMREVVASFAEHAEGDLVFKTHPLDSGMEPWAKIIANFAKEFGVEGRLHFIQGGDLFKMIEYSAGVITINSTTGLHALQRDCPVKVLGMATYDIEGLTDTRPLDAFWKDPKKPDVELRDAFFRLIGASIQVRGNFYKTKGRKRAVDEICEKLLNDQVNEPNAFVDPPPRLAEARRRGVPHL